MPPWLNMKALYVVAFVGVGIAGFFFIRWLTSEPPEVPTSKSLAAAWGEVIQQFKIEPVFPPEEDLVVGDVLAYVVADNDPVPVEQGVAVDTIDYRLPFLNRGVKLAHVNVRQQLQDTYGEFPVFPDASSLAAPDRKPAGGDTAPPQGNVVRLFTQDVLESNLPRAVFAKLKSSVSSSAAGGLAANDQASASYGRSNQGFEEFQLGEVSTYGLPSARALSKLEEYCRQPETRDVCQEATVRKHLRRVVGDRIYRKYLNKQAAEVYAIEVGIVIVNRVYLARSIVHRRTDGRAQSGSFFGSLFPSSENKADKPAESGETGTTADAALKKRVDELEKQVASMKTGGGLSSQTSASAESAFDTGRLSRPVAFGFRYVAYDFPEELNGAGAQK
jgi:hypothetical protein